MKAVILAAGEGKRLKPITTSLPKPMIPLGGIPLLEHTILGLKSANITEILIIVGFKQEIIKQYFGEGNRLGVKISYITQEEYRGTAHATGYAKEFVKRDSFLMIYGDIVTDRQLFKEIVEEYTNCESDALISLLQVENPQNFGIITLNKNGHVTKIVEKPSPEMNVGNLANAGIYVFPPIIFDAIEQTTLSKRNEFELTDSLEIFIKKFKKTIFGMILTSYWNDVGLPWQLLEANEYLLTKLHPSIKGFIEENVIIRGDIHVGEGTIIKSGSYIEGPCYIGKNCIIGPNAFIRSGSNIQDNCIVGRSEVKNSIILSNTTASHFNYIGDSIVCNNVNLGAGTKIANLRLDEKDIKMMIKNQQINSQRKKLGAIIGPNVKIGINVSIMCGKKIGENVRIGASSLVVENIKKNTLYYQDPNKGVIKKKLK